jgi:hypothetical protein
MENSPAFESSQPAVLLLELNAAGNRMRIYNGETKRIVLDLIKVSPGFYDKYIEFIKTNTVPKDLIIPTDLLEGWPGDIKIAPPYGGEKLSYAAASNLRLRSMPGTDGEIITTIKQGEKVLPLEPGLSATIDGIRAPWVWVETADGRHGWCFSAYLEPLDAQAKEYVAATRKLKYEPPAPPPEIPSPLSPPEKQETNLAEPEKTGEEDGGAIPYAALIGGGAAIALAGVFIMFALLRKKKT